MVRRPGHLSLVVTLFLSLMVVRSAGAQAQPEDDQELSPGLGPAHGLAMHGDPALPADYDHLPYANPHAPKGGSLTLSEVATFDSLNPFIVLGRPMWYMRFPRRVFETLMIRSRDEPFTVYGLLAQSIDVPDDRSWVAFTLNEKARFSDGSPVTVEDVIFSFEALRDKGRPFYRFRHRKVARIDRPGPRQIRFVFGEDVDDRELPLLLATMPVFSKAYFETHGFDKTSLKPPIGSGPYRVADVAPGRRLVFERNPDYWGADLAVNRGFNNFDRIIFDYYRDANTAFEAFKAGTVDLHRELQANGLRWARGYDFPAMRKGLVTRAELRPAALQGMFAFAINTRRPPFDDIRVREALVLAFDFPWINKTYFFGAFERSSSFYPGTDLTAAGPASTGERALLAAFPDAVRPDILERGLRFDDQGDYYVRTRQRLSTALDLLNQAGFEIEGGVLKNSVTGRPLSPEIMLEHPEQQRVALAYAAELRKIGIEARIRLVDSSQFQTRSRAYEFDLMPFLWPSSLSPGNEQRFRWSSAAAEQPGSYNFPGVRSKAADMLIDALVAARSRQELVNAARALDRVLLSGFYVVPLYYLPVDRIAWWKHVTGPEEHGKLRVPIRGFGREGMDSWWAVPNGGRSAPGEATDP